MKSTKSAGRYAKALLELATEQQKLQVVEANMERVLKTSAENHDFTVFLKSPVIKQDKKIAILNEIFSDFDALTIAFFKLMTNNGRESLILEIAHSFLAQLKEMKGIVPISITSAKQLDAATKQNIIDKISASVKGTLEISEIIDEKLIGGFVVRMGDKQIDASVANQLKRLKQELTK